MLIGILQCDEVRESMRDKFDDYPDMFRCLLSRQDPQLEFTTYRLIDGVFPQDPDACDAYLITGSRAGVYEEHTWIESAEALVRQLLDARKPVVGICFGHQLIAQAMGGRVEKSTKGWGVGIHHWQTQNTPWWMEGTPASFSMLVSHQDQVVALPEGAECIASSEFCRIAAFQLGDYALGFQGHPEFAHGYSRALMDLRKDTLGEKVYCDGMASLAGNPDSDVVAGWMLKFMRGR